MSYLVLARKWRPQNFDEVVGQEPVTQTLKNALAQGRVAHAFLFSGPRGIGKTSVARILAKAVNCVSGPTPSPCNHCQCCQEISRGTCLDVLEIDGASNRGIDEIRELRENIKYLPAQGRYKVYIIDEVHMLTKEAFNALLKTLEEPPSHVLFIMATTEVHKVPVTILSRCQRYDFKRLPAALIQEYLGRLTSQEGWGLEPEGLQLIAREAEGSMRDALGLLDQVVTFGGHQVPTAEIARILGVTDRKLLLQALTAIIQRNGAELLQLVEEIHDQGLDLHRFYQDLVLYSRHLVVASLGPEVRPQVEVADPEWEQLQALAQHHPTPHLYNLLTVLLKGGEDLNRAPVLRLALEILLLRLVHLEPLVPLAEWLERLAALEARLPTGSTETEVFPDSAAIAEKARPPAPPPSPVPPEAEIDLPPAERWQQFLAFVQAQEGKSPAAELPDIRLLREENHRLIIAPGKTGNAAEALPLARLQELAQQYFGSDYQLVLEPPSPPHPTPTGAASRKAASVAEIKQYALELFGGQWITEPATETLDKEESA